MTPVDVVAVFERHPWPCAFIVGVLAFCFFFSKG